MTAWRTGTSWQGPSLPVQHYLFRFPGDLLQILLRGRKSNVSQPFVAVDGVGTGTQSHNVADVQRPLLSLRVC